MLEVAHDFPEFIKDFRYVIFKEEDMLGLNYHSVCIDFLLTFYWIPGEGIPVKPVRGLRIPWILLFVLH